MTMSAFLPFLPGGPRPTPGRSRLFASPWVGTALAVVLFVAFVGCAKKPPQPPGPPNEPVCDESRTCDCYVDDVWRPCPAPDTSLLLRRDETTLIRHDDGQPFPWQGCEHCCWDADPDGDGIGWTHSMGWPVINRDWVDFAVENGCNVVHGRLGPFLRYRSIGAAPYVEVNGKADLARFDPRFWDFLDDVDAYAESKGVVRVWDLIDGWGCRHGLRDLDHPFEAEHNVQGIDALSSCGRSLNETQRAFVRQAVTVLGKRAGVVWEDGNEIGLVWGYSPDWTSDLRALVFEVEQAQGYPIHIFGTNGGPNSWHTPADLVFVHNRGAATSSKADKPTVVNEYNPSPPLTAQAWFREFCESKAIGSYFDLWRHGMGDDVYTEALRLMREGVCPAGPPDLSACPKPLDQDARVLMRNHQYPGGAEPTRGPRDSSVYVEGDPEFCRLIHGVSVTRCHLEGWPKRTECEVQLLGAHVGKPAACPIWQFNSPTGPRDCLQASDPCSCDHFGDPMHRDDPHTPAFEGQPEVCAQQRDVHGNPRAGFFTVAHGACEVRACRPDGQGCGRWDEVNW